MSSSWSASTSFIFDGSAKESGYGITNQWTGTDAASPMSVMARRLSIQRLRVVAVPHTLRGDRGRYGAVMLDVYGPEQPGKIHNDVRALGASNG